MLDLAPLPYIWYTQAKHSSTARIIWRSTSSSTTAQLVQNTRSYISGSYQGKLYPVLENVQPPGLSITSVGHASRGEPRGTRTSCSFVAHLCAAMKSLLKAPGSFSLIFVGHLLISEVTHAAFAGETWDQSSLERSLASSSYWAVWKVQSSQRSTDTVPGVHTAFICIQYKHHNFTQKGSIHNRN